MSRSFCIWKLPRLPLVILTLFKTNDPKIPWRRNDTRSGVNVPFWKVPPTKMRCPTTSVELLKTCPVSQLSIKQTSYWVTGLRLTV